MCARIMYMYMCSANGAEEPYNTKVPLCARVFVHEFAGYLNYCMGSRSLIIWVRARAGATCDRARREYLLASFSVCVVGDGGVVMLRARCCARICRLCDDDDR